MVQSINQRMKLQSAEFDALDALVKAYDRLRQTPIVDDDYPEMRHYYEGAVTTFLRACRDNGRNV